MSTLSSRKRLGVSLLTTAFVASTLTTAFVVPNLARAETIIVESCNPGLIELRSGSELTCLNPNDSRGDGSSDPPGDPYGDGGTGGTRPRGTRPNPAEARRRQRCQQCQAASQACQSQALLAKTTCRVNAEAQARERCDFKVRGATNTVTAWGCSIWDHVADQCRGVEAPWNDPQRWSYGCRTEGNARVCGGPGVDNCVASWRVSHAGGSRSLETSGEVSATFEGVGAQANQTITETYSWNGRTGYLETCEAAGGRLEAACTRRENSCYQANRCTADDL